MAKKSSKKDNTAKAKSILDSVFGGTPKTCSKAGSKLATDKLPGSKKSTAGKKLGSMACKAPARRKKVGKR